MDEKNKDTQDSLSEIEELKSLGDKLTGLVPDRPRFDEFPKYSYSPMSIQIDRANHEAEGILKDAKLAVIRSYLKNEEERTRRQRPLLFIIAGLTFFQLSIFNVIIGAVVYFSFRNAEPSVLAALFGVLKYYIGATVTELIGMIAVITTGTYSLNHIKTMELLLKDKKSDKTKTDHEENAH